MRPIFRKKRKGGWIIQDPVTKKFMKKPPPRPAFSGPEVGAMAGVITALALGLCLLTKDIVFSILLALIERMPSFMS